jgi:hypothetical protein
MVDRGKEEIEMKIVKATSCYKIISINNWFRKAIIQFNLILI